jgi:conjugal transfer/type IV secretion protein DotA/TraY
MEDNEQNRLTDSRLARISGEVSGVRPLINGLKGILLPVSAWKQARSAFSALASASKSNLPTIPAKISAQSARFAWLQKQQGLTDQDILEMRATAKKAFIVWFLATSAMLLLAIVAPRLGLAAGSQTLLPWFLVLPMLAKTMQWSLWHHQLTQRALVPFFTWLKNPRLWMAPADDLGAKAPSAGTTMLLVMGLVPLFSTIAWAQTGVPSTGVGANGVGNVVSSMMGPLASGDLSLQWMEHLFPSLWPDVTGVTYAQDAVAQLINNLNVLLTGIAGALLTWHTVVGMVNTAHEGKVLGQRWHQIWAPIRVMMGFTAVVPIKGFCVAQLLVIQIFLAGFGLANVEWNLYVNLSTGLSGSTAITVPPDSMAQMPTLVALLSSETCVKAAQYANSTSNGAGTLPTPATLDSLNSRSVFSSGRAKYLLPDPNGTVMPILNPDGTPSGLTEYVWDYGTVCGRIAWPVHVATASAPTPVSNQTPLLNIPTSSNLTADEAQQQFDTDRAQAFGAFVSAVRNSNVGQSAAQMFTPGQAPSLAQADLAKLVQPTMTAFTAFKSSVLSSSGTLSKNLNLASRKAFQARAVALGWASAGAIQPLIVRANATVIQRVSESPIIDAPNLAGANLNPDTQKVLSTALRAIGDAITNQSANAPGTSVDYDIDMTKSASANPARAFGMFMDHASKWFTRATLNFFRLDTADPIGSIQDLGQGLIAGVTLVWITPWGAMNALSGAISGGADGLSNIPVIGWFAGTIGKAAAGALSKVLAGFVGMWTTTATWLLAIGAGFAIVIPLMEYIMWLFAIIGIITYVVEAVVGASFWAFAHVRMDGAELIDQPQKHGYALCFNAMFRPALLVLGLIMGNVAFSVMAAFVNATFVITADTSISFVDPVSWIVLLGTLLYIHFQLAIRSYALITLLPDRIARWSGASGEGLGEEGYASGAHTNIIAGVNNMGNRLPTGRKGGANPELVSAIREAMGTQEGDGGGGNGAKMGTPSTGPKTGGTGGGVE